MNNLNFSSSYFNFMDELKIAEDEVKWADEIRETNSLLKEFSIPEVDMEALYRRRRNRA